MKSSPIVFAVWVIFGGKIQIFDERSYYYFTFLALKFKVSKVNVEFARIF